MQRKYVSLWPGAIIAIMTGIGFAIGSAMNNGKAGLEAGAVGAALLSAVLTWKELR